MLKKPTVFVEAFCDSLKALQVSLAIASKIALIKILFSPE